MLCSLAPAIKAIVHSASRVMCCCITGQMWRACAGTNSAKEDVFGFFVWNGTGEVLSAWQAQADFVLCCCVGDACISVMQL